MKPVPPQIRTMFGVIIGLVLLSCSERDRNNPLDPRNPGTQGRPMGLVAVSMEQQVHLRWSPITFKDLQAIHIYRRSSEDSLFRRIDQTLTASYIDRYVQYGIRYEYYITALAGGYETDPSNVVHTTPGPTYTWISDYQAGSVICLTHDLEGEVTRFGMLYYPQVLTVSPKERSVWVSVRYEEQLFKISRNSQITAAVPNMDAVVDIAADTVTLDVWVAQKNPGRLTRIDSYGAIRATTNLLEQPTAIAVPTYTGICWVLDGGDRTLKAFGMSGERVLVTEQQLHRPMDIAYAAHNRTLWVADSSAIIQFNLTGSRTGLTVEPFYYVSLLAYDNKNKWLWAIDWERWGEPAKLIKMDHRGNQLFTVDAFSYPIALTVNEFDGSCLVGDSGYDHYGLYRVTADGAKIDQIGQFYLPLSVAIEYQ